MPYRRLQDTFNHQNNTFQQDIISLLITVEMSHNHMEAKSTNLRHCKATIGDPFLDK